MTDTRVIRPAEQPPRPITAIVPEVCPCGSTYVARAPADPALHEAWAVVHRPHGLGEGR